MVNLEDYVARVDGTCGKDKDVIVTFKYDRKDEAIRRILDKSAVKKSFARIVFELTFKDSSFRLYGNGKAIFRDLKDRNQLDALLSELLL